MAVWRQTVAVISLSNGLGQGRTADFRHRRLATSHGLQVKDEQSVASIRAMRALCKEVAALVRERRRLVLTGAHAEDATLLKASLSDDGYLRTDSSHVRQIPLIAHAIAEPTSSDTVPLLDALPPEVSRLYSKEENILDYANKCSMVFREIEAHY